MYVRRLKRKCSVRGCKNTDTFDCHNIDVLNYFLYVCFSSFTQS